MDGQQPRSEYYGRRSSRRLTGARIDLLKTVLAKYEVVSPLPALDRPLWLEIGFGSGEHLLAQAREHPEVSFIGCEPFLNGVAALVRVLEADRITNVGIYPDDARLLLGTLPDASVDRVYVLFADPWPKSRHNRRRMIGLGTLDVLDRVMTETGELYLATDHVDLAEWYRQGITEHPAFTLQPACAEGAQVRPDWPATRYEAKALAAGRQPWYFRVTRRDRRSG